MTQIREDIYDMNTLRFVETIWQDLRYGLRLIVRTRRSSLVAILTLALGTGANAAIFQLVNAVRLRTLPVERPQELVSIGINTNDTRPNRPVHEPAAVLLRAALAGDPRRAAGLLASVFAWGITTWNLATDGEYRPAQGLYVSGDFFQALGVGAQVGRLLSDGDDQKGCGAPGAVLTARILAVPLRRQPRRRSARRSSLDGRPFDDHRRHAAGVLRRRGRPHVRRRGAAVRRAADPRRRSPGSARLTSGSSTSWAA